MILAKDNHGNTRLTGSRGRTWPLEVRRECKLSMLSRLSKLSRVKIVKIVKCDKIEFVQIIKIVNRSRESVCFKPSPRHDHWRPGRRHHQQLTTITIISTTNRHNLNHPCFSQRSFRRHLSRKMPRATQTAPRFITKEKKNIEKSDNLDQYDLMRTIVTRGGYCLVGQLWWVGGGRQGGHQCRHGVRPWWPWRWWWWW